MFQIIRRYSTNIQSIKYLLDTNKPCDDIKIQGWVKAIRKMKDNIFFDVNDGSTNQKLQVVVSSALQPTELTTGSSVVAKGNISLTPKGQLELKAEELDVVGKCKLEDGYPFAPRKTYAAEYIRQYLHLRPRTNSFSSMLRIRDKATMAIHEHLHDEGYIQINTPILTSNDCEGAGEVFTVMPDNQTLLKQMKRDGKSNLESYFNDKVFLSVSGQLHLEAAAHALSKVYTLGPTFRAENSKSRLHLSEFYMLEVESCFVTKLEDVLSNIEQLIRVVTNKIASSNEFNLELENISNWIDKTFPVLTYDEACSILKQHQTDFNHLKGISKEDELFLVKHCNNIPTFVINWPKNVKPFYMKLCSDDDNKVAAFDLLAPNVGEIAGGSLREDNYEKLNERLPSDMLNWYLDLRKFGNVPSGGYGLGFERYLLFLLGVNSIKDVIPYPRWPHNCKL